MGDLLPLFFPPNVEPSTEELLALEEIIYERWVDVPGGGTLQEFQEAIATTGKFPTYDNGRWE